jgi:ABC-type nitrate/sulfonate/bicarbonate transport system substrate-binding protein
MRNVRLGTFSPSVLVEVATVTGQFAEAGLSVREVPATSSPQQFTDLFTGELDAALTNPDNVLAYRCVADNPLHRTGDVRILSAVDRGLGLSLFTAPGRDDLAQIHGGTVAVDVPGLGFAFVALELLARHGLRAGVDFTVRAFGSTPRRTEALLAGTCEATVLNAGNDLVAEGRGAHRMDPVGAIGPYVGAVLAATGAALERDREVLRSMVGVVCRVGAALVRGEHRELALAVAKDRLGLDDDGARRYLRVLADPESGLVPDGRLRAAELVTLVDLRNRHRRNDPPLAPAQVLRSGLVDESLLPVQVSRTCPPGRGSHPMPPIR